MKYIVQRLDGRFSFRKHFEYFVGFTGRMSNQQGPLYFNIAQQWFTRTYGWSAEVRQWEDITRYISNPFYYVGSARPPDMPDCVNPQWSWTNGYDDLRIYVASGKELAFFQLSHPVDR